MKPSLKEQLAAVAGEKKSCGKDSQIQEIFDRYKQEMSGKIIETRVPESVHLCDENFPHWIKLQRQNPDTGCWEDAYAAIVVPLLQAGQFTDEGYRMADPRRAPALPYVPHLLKRPDTIRRREDGDHFYFQRYRHYFKVALTRLNEQTGQVILVASYPTESMASYEGFELIYDKTKAAC